MAKKSSKKSKGLGDTIEKALDNPVGKALKKLIFKDGEDCGCDERKKKLNKVFRYKLKPRCFTEEEYKEWGTFKDTVTLRMDHNQILYLCKLFSSVMNRQYYKPCTNCSPKPFIYMIDKLNIVYDSYDN